MSNSASAEKISFGLWLTTCLVAIGSGVLAFVLEQWWLLAIPFLPLLIYWTMADVKAVFLLLLFCIPLSIEFYFPNGFATDLPTEPLMLGLMAVFLWLAASKPGHLSTGFLLHPIVLLIVAHWFWIFIAALNSVNTFVSFKFFLAKSWYIIVFVFLAGIVFRQPNSIRKIFWVMFPPSLLVVVVSLFRHGWIDGFAFEEVNRHVVPYFRNHVSYGAYITLFLPFIFMASGWYKKGTWKRRLLNISKVIFFVAIYFSYTRACWLAVIVAGTAWVLIRWNLLRPVMMAGIIAVLVLGFSMAKDNEYLRFSPEYEKTLTFRDFDEHLMATFRGEDASSMERFYRWIAGLYMIQQHPWLGYGPGNFYPYYQQFTVNSFETYISDNEERSTIHNYFLLILTEQGIIGLLIFLALVWAIFSFGQKIWLETKDPDRKRVVMALLLSLIIIMVNLLLSDLIEVDKTGTLFFLFVTLLIVENERNRTGSLSAT